MLMHASACLLDYIVCCNISSTLCYWPNTQSDVGSLACLRNMLHGGGGGGVAPLFAVSSPNSNSQLLKPRGGIALKHCTPCLYDRIDRFLKASLIASVKRRCTQPDGQTLICQSLNLRSNRTAFFSHAKCTSSAKYCFMFTCISMRHY